MADIQNIIDQNKEYVVLAGIAVALLYAVDVLPHTTDILTLGDNVRYVYAAIEVLAGFVFYNFYMARKHSIKRSFNMERTVPSRNISNPNYGRPQQPRVRAPPSPAATGKPSKEFLDKFDREE